MFLLSSPVVAYLFVIMAGLALLLAGYWAIDTVKAGRKPKARQLPKDVDEMLEIMRVI